MAQGFKESFHNRHGLAIVALVERPEKTRGLIFIQHGMFGFKEQPTMQALAETALAQGYTVVRFDATHALGESGGDPAQTTITAAVDDLADVIDWSWSQPWFLEPFVLAGYSMGSIAALEYTNQHTANLQGLAVLGCVVTGRLTYDAAVASDPAAIAEWQERGYREMQLDSLDKAVRVPWSHMTDRFQYDALRYAPTLALPVFMFSGHDDTVCLPAHQQLLFDALSSGDKQLHLIPGAAHSYDTDTLNQLQNVFASWLVSLTD